MADEASSYLEGVRSGQSLGNNALMPGIEAYQGARRYRDQLAEKAQAHADAAKVLKTEADRYTEKIGMEKEAAAEKKSEFGVKSAETARQDAETKRHNMATEVRERGAYAGGGRKVPPEVEVAMKNRDSVRKTISALAAGGVSTPPPEMQAKLDTAEGALSRVAKKNNFDLGEDDEDSKNSAITIAVMKGRAETDAYNDSRHPIDWLKRITGQDVPVPGSVVTKYRGGKPVQVIAHEDGTFTPLPGQ